MRDRSLRDSGPSYAMGCWSKPPEPHLSGNGNECDINIVHTMTTTMFSGDTLRGRSPSSVPPLNLGVGVV